MTLDTLFSGGTVIHALHTPSKKKLFQELASRLEAQGALSGSNLNAGDIVNAAMERERLGTTGLGSGVALPHARLDGIDRVFGAFATLDTPLDYDAIDERPVDLVAMLIAPKDGGSAHLRALARISRHLRREDVRSRLRTAPNAQSLHMSLTNGA